MEAAVGFIAKDLVPVEFVQCLTSLLSAQYERFENLVISGKGYAGRLDIGRESIVKTFLDQTDAKYLLFLDTDIVFTPQEVDILFEANYKMGKDTTIVSGLYVRPDGKPCAFVINSQFNRLEVARFNSLASMGSLYPVSAVGLGFCLIPRGVFDRLGDKYPDGGWFTPPLDTPGMRLADDTSFCLRAKEAGAQILVDSRASVGHLKTVALRPTLDMDD